MAQLFSEPNTRRVCTAWLLLVVATIVSWKVGIDHAIDYRLSTTLVLVVAFVKVNLVGMNFMELREAILPLRAIFNAFCVVVCVGLVGMYLTNT